MGRDVYERRPPRVPCSRRPTPCSACRSPEALLRRTRASAAAHRGPAARDPATSIALLRALEERVGRVAAAFVAGHSLGEYSALVAAGALDASRTRCGWFGRAASTCATPTPPGVGAMAAIVGCDRATVEAACARARAASGEVVEPANFNAPAQTVIAGTVAGVRAACDAAQAAGAKRVLPLPVSAPFHCSLMAPAAERLRVDLARIRFCRPEAARRDERRPRSPTARRHGFRGC